MDGSERSALIVVDMQNAFIGSDDAPGVPGAAEVVKAVNELVAEVADRWPVFYTKDVAPFDLPEEALRHQVELHPDLDVRGTVVPKGPGKDGGFSGFVLAEQHSPDGSGPGTGGLGPLAELLAWSKVDSVVVVGLAGDVCVAATARDARRLGYEVTMPLHATAFVHAHPQGDEAALRDLRAAGITVTGRPAA
jgi:nicotinamidase/pyrazinamidase